MSQEFFPSRLDVHAFSRDQATLSGLDPLSLFPRLLHEAQGHDDGRQVQWRAQGALLTDASGNEQCWLHVQATLRLLQTCQRCLEPVELALLVDRNFRFVATEAQAEAEDEDCEEDLLAISKTFDLLSLVEDELLMELPLVPLHDVCPSEVTLSAQDAHFEQPEDAKPNPFAVLSKLQNGKSG